MGKGRGGGRGNYFYSFRGEEKKGKEKGGGSRARESGETGGWMGCGRGAKRGEKTRILVKDNEREGKRKGKSFEHPGEEKKRKCHPYCRAKGGSLGNFLIYGGNSREKGEKAVNGQADRSEERSALITGGKR